MRIKIFRGVNVNREKIIPVWDIFVRIFHWSLVTAFITSYMTRDETSIVHVYSGYTVLGLISFRVVWGLVGTKYARFSNFIYPPKDVLDYLKSLFQRF